MRLTITRGLPHGAPDNGAWVDIFAEDVPLDKQRREFFKLRNSRGTNSRFRKVRLIDGPGEYDMEMTFRPSPEPLVTAETPKKKSK